MLPIKSVNVRVQRGSWSYNNCLNVPPSNLKWYAKIYVGPIWINAIDPLNLYSMSALLWHRFAATYTGTPYTEPPPSRLLSPGQLTLIGDFSESFVTVSVSVLNERRWRELLTLAEFWADTLYAVYWQRVGRTTVERGSRLWQPFEWRYSSSECTAILFTRAKRKVRAVIIWRGTHVDGRHLQCSTHYHPREQTTFDIWLRPLTDEVIA